jgi:hypothetical protein
MVKKIYIFPKANTFLHLQKKNSKKFKNYEHCTSLTEILKTPIWDWRNQFSLLGRV